MWEGRISVTISRTSSAVSFAADAENGRLPGLDVHVGGALVGRLDQ